MTKSIHFLLLLFLFFSIRTNAQAGKSNPVFENDIAIENWLRENNVPVLGIGIIEQGKLKQIKIFGEIKKGITAPYNTIFNVASLAKSITSMVALHLVNSGKWNLDEPIYTYWTDPDIANDPRSKKLTTRLILSHQTGFPNWRWMKENKKLSFDFEPGTQYQYSGEGMEYLRKAIENKFKKSIEQLASELIFQPLQMNDTHYIWDKNTDESRFAIGYDKEGKPYELIKNKKANAADDLHTTIGDYGNFLVHILEEGNLNKNVYQEMIKKQVKTKENKYFGLGFEIYDLGNGELALSHGGSDKGSQCITFILPDTRQGILIFTNADEGYKVYEDLLINYLGEKGKRIIEIETKN
ncbi:CubicO group peptidase (beta-lactamase class C family) [Chryseobacterium defluvii]|uniref:CubicO group peptidase (Beta-lactamase class C family) n=1 Tax=Chryseobacterium defluvii TaxID=160396 RepID=A0A840KFA9_9FLAO|nr:serine hydrolase domain-containing protein [Chryseobacterium defluvii]MBB4806708.1 CubicO group peptidase (beta-lactamase class C family) [Chryseobacterium defluvii]